MRFKKAWSAKSQQSNQHRVLESIIMSNGHTLNVITVRFTTGTTRLAKLPGWDKDSWGYHGDDGCSFADQRTGSTYGPTFTRKFTLNAR